MVPGHLGVAPGVHAPRLVTALLAVALGVSACGEGGAATAQPTAEPTAEPAGQPSAADAHPLDFASTTTTGEAFDGAELVGEDVVLWFWAPWCTVCRSEAPQVEAAAEQLDGQVRVVGVASSGSLVDMQAFVAETGSADLTHVADVPGEVWARFGVVTQPTFVFVDDDGRTQTVPGGLPQAALVDAMEQLADA
jgi:thiol-disulfide isomerase/thioredoxin